MLLLLLLTSTSIGKSNIVIQPIVTDNKQVLYIKHYSTYCDKQWESEETAPMLFVDQSFHMHICRVNVKVSFQKRRQSVPEPYPNLDYSYQHL